MPATRQRTRWAPGAADGGRHPARGAARLTRRALPALALASSSAVLAGACVPGQAHAPPPASPAKRAAGGTAVFMAWGDPQRSQIRDGLVPRILAETGVTAQWIHTEGGDAYYDKLLAMMAAGTAPDLFLFATSYFAGWAQEGKLTDLSPLIRRDRYDLADFPDKGLAQYRWQGDHQLAFPQDFPTRSLFYNVASFQRAGIPLPPGDYGFAPAAWSWQGFLDTARKLTTGDPEAGGTYGWNTQFGLRQYLAWIVANGGQLFNRAVTECTVTDPKTVEALGWMADLVHTYRVAPTLEVTQAEKYDALFTSGRVAMIESNPGSINTYRTVEGFTFDVAPVPVAPGGAKVATGGGSGQGSWSGSQHVDAAWEFLKFMMGPEAELAHARSGATFPSRKSLALDPQVAVPGRPPAHFALFVDGWQYLRSDPDVSNWQDIQAAIDQELLPLWQGRRSAREAATATKAVVDPLLKDAGARKPLD